MGAATGGPRESSFGCGVLPFPVEVLSMRGWEGPMVTITRIILVRGILFSARRGCVGEGEVPTGGSKKAFPGRVYWLSGLE